MKAVHNDNTKFKWLPNRKTGVACLSCFVIFVLGCALGSVIINWRIAASAESVSISDVIITTGVDSEGNPFPSTNRFPPEQSRIYCVVKTSSSKPINVGVRWYWKETLIFEDYALVYGWRAFLFNHSPEIISKAGNIEWKCI